MAAPLRISVFDSTILQAAVLSIRAANKEVQAEIRRFTKSEVSPEFSEQMHENSETKLEAYVLADTSRVTVSNQTVRLSAGTVGGALSGGLNPGTDIAPVEFGADPAKESTFMQRSRKGRSYQVTKHTHRQFRPPRRNGYVFYPTVARMIPRFASLWVQTAMRTIGDAIDKAAGSGK